jgi:ZipA, C-terminal FtsZ-binding domain
MTLTVALVIVAVLVLVAIVAQSIWSARNAAPRRPEPDRDSPPRLEPSLGSGTADAHAAAGAAETGAAGDAPAPPPRRAPREMRIDALIDAIAPLTLDAPVPGELALSHLPPSHRAGTKPFHIEGLNTESAEWELPLAGQHYGEFQAGVQLANRNGALNEIEYSEFVQKVQHFADSIGALPDFPDMLEAASRARELDQFASQYDAQLAVHLRASSVAWSVGYLHQCAARNGFVPGPVPGQLVLPGEDGAPPLLRLSFDAQAALAEDPSQAALREATLTLDVPQTAESAAPFAAWQKAACAVAEDMDATVVDDDGRPVTEQSFAAIGEALGSLYRALDERDLAAGSPAARRLFS